jgi:hypothetical protein
LVYEKAKVDHSKTITPDDDASSMDNLIAKLSEQQAILEQQKSALVTNAESNSNGLFRDESNTDSTIPTPTSGSSNATPSTETGDEDKTPKLSAPDMLKLQKELDAARDKIARQEQELSQTRANKHMLDQAKGIAVQGHINTSGRPLGSYGNQDDARSDISDVVSTCGFNRGQNVWSNMSSTGFIPPLGGQVNVWDQGINRAFLNRPMLPPLPPLMVPQQQQMQHRPFSGPTSPSSGNSGRFMNDFSQFQGGQGLRRSNTQNSRSGSSYGGQNFTQGRNHGWDSYNSSSDGSPLMGISSNGFPQMGMFQAPMAYQPRPIGTPLSPTAAEFTSGPSSSGPWNSTVRHKLGYRLYYSLANAHS